MTILPAGVFLFAPACAVVAYRFVAPLDFGLGVGVALLAAVVGVWLWPFVAFVLWLPFMPGAARRSRRKEAERRAHGA